jgi:hypothetical protein
MGNGEQPVYVAANVNCSGSLGAPKIEWSAVTDRRYNKFE